MGQIAEGCLSAATITEVGSCGIDTLRRHSPRCSRQACSPHATAQRSTVLAAATAPATAAGRRTPVPAPVVTQVAESSAALAKAPFGPESRRAMTRGAVRPVHHDAPRVRHGLHVGIGVGTRRYHDAQYAHGYSVHGAPYVGFGFGYPYAYAYGYRYANGRTGRIIDTSQPPALRVVGPGVVSGDDILVVEEVSATVVRLSW